MSYVAKTICDRAGWEYQPFPIDRALPSPVGHYGRRKQQTGYGIYFSGPAARLSDIGDILDEKIDDWNGRRANLLHLSRFSLNGWVIGGDVEEFIYLRHPLVPFPQARSCMASRRLHLIADYRPAPEQSEIPALFVTDLLLDCADPALFRAIGAFQITYIGL